MKDRMKLSLPPKYPSYINQFPMKDTSFIYIYIYKALARNQGCQGGRYHQLGEVLGSFSQVYEVLL
jgi:hypothetical protein